MYDGWASGTSLQNRKDIVYVGANDGMLHAIDFKTGIEKWAFIPPFILPKLPNIINESYNDDNKKHVLFIVLVTVKHIASFIVVIIVLVLVNSYSYGYSWLEVVFKVQLITFGCQWLTF